MARDKEFNILLSKYNTAIAKAQDLQEQLTTKQKQWEKRDEDFAIMEKLVRELCEDILAKDSREMVLGTDYSWSSVPINELIIKSKRVFKEYCVQRTDFMRKIMDTSEQRLQEIESLNEQISIMKTNPGTVGISQEELKEQIDREKKEQEVISNIPHAIRETVDEGTTQIILEDKDDMNLEEKMLGDMADIGAMLQMTPKSIPVTATRKQIERKKERKKKKMMAHTVDLNEYKDKLSDIDWEVLKILGSTGFSRFAQIEEAFANLDLKPKPNVRRCRISVKNLSNLGLFYQEKVVNPLKGSFSVYQLTDMGSRIYQERYGKPPVMAEMDFIIAEHNNCQHGYGIRLVAEMLQEKGIYESVTDENRKNPISLGQGIDYIPDIICVDSNGVKTYIEYECANHNQKHFNAKCSKMVKVTNVLNFVGPNRESVDKLCAQVESWIKSRGATSLRHATIRITSALQMKDSDILIDSGWKFVYHPGKSDKPQVNF